MADNVHGEGLEALAELRTHLAALEQNVSTLLLRFGEQEQELQMLHDIVVALSEKTGGPTIIERRAVSGTAASGVTITPELREVLRLIHGGKAEEAKTALAAIPPEERNAYPAVLAIVAAALCVAKDDYSRALAALEKAKQLTDDPRLLRLAELVGQKVPQPS